MSLFHYVIAIMEIGGHHLINCLGHDNLQDWLRITHNFLLIFWTMSTIRLQLLIHPKKNRVVFAESQKEFVDILLSFLTLPIGTIIRLLNKQSSLGCIDNIYRSVENLDTKYLNTKACKTMLHEPRSSAEVLCEDLFIKVDNLKPRRAYRCPDFDCFTEKTKAYSSVSGVNCSCGKTMDRNIERVKKMKEKEEVFLKGEATYMISDDLHIFPASVSNAVTFFQKFGIDDVDILEKRTVDVNRVELLNILKMLLLSKSPLTDVFLKTPCSRTEKETGLMKFFQINLEDDSKIQDNGIILKLVRDKTTKRVLYAEADHVMVDNLFSFLTFPLGSVVKLLDKISLVGCVDNLYNSVGILASNGICFVSEARKKMLLSPCLYLQYDYSKQILKIESECSQPLSVHGCKICYEKGGKCEHNNTKVIVNGINPKVQNLVFGNRGGYAKDSLKFMISDEMVITPLTLISGIDVVKEFKVSIDDLIFQEVAIGEAQVKNILRACLTSSGVLDSVFSSVQMPNSEFLSVKKPNSELSSVKKPRRLEQCVLLCQKAKKKIIEFSGLSQHVVSTQAMKRLNKA